MLLDCFAPMRWLRARGLACVGYGLASCNCFLFLYVWAMASRQVLGASCLIKFLLAYAVNLFWPRGLAYAFYFMT